MNLTNQPQNFNSNNYNSSPQQTNNNYSIKSKIALVLSILGCTALIGCILAIVDITKKDGTNKKLSKIALGVCGFWLLFSIILSKANKKTDTNISQSMEVTTETVEETTEILSETEQTTEEQMETIETHLYDNAEIKDLINGSGTEKIGEYVLISANSTDCTEENIADVYFNYYLVNDYDYIVILYSDKTDNSGVYVGCYIGVGTIFEKTSNDVYTISNSDNEIIYMPDTNTQSIHITLNNKESADYILKEGELGKYGKVITLNANSDMPVDKYLYKLPSGTYVVTTNYEKMTGFNIVKDEITIEEGNEDYPECLDFVSFSGYLSANPDYNENADTQITITLNDDESISIPTTTPNGIELYFFKQTD